MKNKASSPAYLIVLALLGSVLLTACGDGGGGGSTLVDRVDSEEMKND